MILLTTGLISAGLGVLCWLGMLLLIFLPWQTNFRVKWVERAAIGMLGFTFLGLAALLLHLAVLIAGAVTWTT